MSGELFYYFVEGECEQAFLKAFMHADKGEYFIKPGKVEVRNLLFDKLSNSKVMSIKRGTKVVIVFDTDIKQVDILNDNIDALLSVGLEVIYIPSINNFEDELVKSCSKVKNLDQILNTKGTEEFKKQFIKHKDIVSKLMSVGFDLQLMWSTQPSEPFDKYKNNSSKIKEKRN